MMDATQSMTLEAVVEEYGRVLGAVRGLAELPDDLPLGTLILGGSPCKMANDRKEEATVKE